MLAYKELGYDVKLYATNVPTEVSVRRATDRAISKGRYVPIDFVAQNVEKINKSVRDLTPFADEYKVYNTDVPRGAMPSIIMQGTNAPL